MGQKSAGEVLRAASAEDFKPRAYDLANPEEVRRLLNEVRGYLHTCSHKHHGTDFEGRRFAQEALLAIGSKGAEHPIIRGVNALEAIRKYLEVFDRCGGSESVSPEEFADARHGLRKAIALAERGA